MCEGTVPLLGLVKVASRGIDILAPSSPHHAHCLREGKWLYIILHAWSSKRSATYTNRGASKAPLLPKHTNEVVHQQP